MQGLGLVVLALVGVSVSFPSGDFASLIPDSHPSVVKDLIQKEYISPAGAVINSNRILCPVLAALVKAGDLVPDVNGSCTLEQIRSALRDRLQCESIDANEQATGIAVYNYTQKDIEMHRNRCLPGTFCWEQKQLHGVTRETERWLNIYTMNGKQTVEHGYSTGVRGGATNPPSFDYAGGPCNGEYPCEDRFQKFYVSCADSNGRFYLDNLYCILCTAQNFGDKTGEFAFNNLQSGRQWQMTAAMTGWLFAFGRLDSTGGPQRPLGPGFEQFSGAPAWYFTMDDVRAMIMEGRYPDGWKARPWGNPGSLVHNSQRELSCGSATWWEGTDCPSWTGQYCVPTQTHCGGGAICLSNGHCACGLGSNGVSMCAKRTGINSGECVERDNKCTYFGEPCNLVYADNPAAPF